MANEKQLKSRLLQKHDTEANWNKATNFIPKAGELIVYDVDDTYDYTRLKVGDGITIVSNLPFFSNPDTQLKIMTWGDLLQGNSTTLDVSKEGL